MKKILEKIYDGDLNSLTNKIIKSKKSFVITVNPETIMITKKNKKLSEILDNKEYILVADGIAIVKTYKILFNKTIQRISGIDLMEKLLFDANKKGLSIYLFGASENVIDLMKKKVELNYSNIKLLGVQNGYSKNKEKDFKKIANLNPDIIFVALGIPNQELLIDKFYKEFKKGIFIGVGGSFDVISGFKKRAPKIFIKLNLEWLYRIISEPKRIKRFWNNNVKFLFEVIKEKN